MLILEETGLSLNALKICSILNLLPIQIDVKSGKIQRQSNKIKVFIWKLLFGVGVSHWFFMFTKLVQSTILEPQKYFRWDHFVLHFGHAFVAAVSYLTGFRLFVKTPEEKVIIFNQLFEEREDPVQKMMDQQEQLSRLTKSESGNGKQQGKRGNKTRGKSRAGFLSTAAPRQNEQGQNQNKVIEKHQEILERPRPLLTWPPQYSLDELVAKLIALAAVSSILFTLLIFVMDPSRPQLLYSALPPEWQNLYSFLVLLAVEALSLAVTYVNLSFSVLTQVLFFAKCQLEFKRINLQLRNLEEKFQNQMFGNGGREIEKEIWILRQILEEMRELVVLIELFNRCFPLCIFAWKICSLSLSIVFYFFVIRHSQKFPFLAGFIGYVAIDITLVYTIMYEHAFSIPGKMDELKNEFLLTAQKSIKASTANLNVNKNLKAEMKREIGALRGVGIQVGSFNKMERESTPNFIDFVFRNVVSLLVTFPR